MKLSRIYCPLAVSQESNLTRYRLCEQSEAISRNEDWNQQSSQMAHGSSRCRVEIAAAFCLATTFKESLSSQVRCCHNHGVVLSARWGLHSNFCWVLFIATFLEDCFQRLVFSLCCQQSWFCLSTISRCIQARLREINNRIFAKSFPAGSSFRPDFANKFQCAWRIDFYSKST